MQVHARMEMAYFSPGLTNTHKLNMFVRTFNTFSNMVIPLFALILQNQVSTISGSTTPWIFSHSGSVEWVNGGCTRDSVAKYQLHKTQVDSDNTEWFGKGVKKVAKMALN